MFIAIWYEMNKDNVLLASAFRGWGVKFFFACIICYRIWIVEVEAGISLSR
jgi:hypothetical protein